MKLLYIANIRLPTEKAHGIQIMTMCEAFARLGHTVELVVPSRRTPITEDPFSYYGVERTFTITRLPTFDTVSWGRAGFWLQVLSFIFHAARYARRSSAEVIYSRDPALFFFGRMPLGTKLVWEIHTKPTLRVAKMIRKSLVRIVAISGGLRDVLVESGVPQERIIVAHDAVNADMFAHILDRQTTRRELSLPQDKKLIAYIGKYKTMGESKGVEEVIAVVGAVHATHADAALLLVGLNPDEFAEVEMLTEAAGLAGAAYLIGHVEHKNVARYMRAADVLVMNYPNTEHYARFMSPLKLFEYMASGTPIVTSDLPSIREVLDDVTAYFFKADDSDDFHKTLEGVLGDPTTASKKAHAALRKVEELTWQKRAERIIVLAETMTSVCPVSTKMRMDYRMMIRYIVSGGMGAAIQFTSFYLLNELAGVWYLYAVFLSFVAALIVVFLMQKFWTFRSFSKPAFKKEFISYTAVALFSVLLNAALMYSMVDLFGMRPIVSQAFAIISIMPISYFLNKTITFAP
ncbi:MAG: GtrA family protein [Minisyncoccota bacterium]